jgi:hypothetical protein
MSGEVSHEQIDLSVPETGVYYYIETDRHYKITLYPTMVAKKVTVEGSDYANGVGVTSLNNVGSHITTLITRIISRGVELRVRSRDGVVDHRVGTITLITTGNC